MSKEIDPYQCWSCKAALVRATGVNTDDKMEPGVIALCAHCGSLSECDGAGIPRPLKDIDAVERPELVDALAIQERIRFYRGMSGGHN